VSGSEFLEGMRGEKGKYRVLGRDVWELWGSD
jgi:hypothetical protein